MLTRFGRITCSLPLRQNRHYRHPLTDEPQHSHKQCVCGDAVSETLLDSKPGCRISEPHTWSSELLSPHVSTTELWLQLVGQSLGRTSVSVPEMPCVSCAPAWQL